MNNPVKRSATAKQAIKYLLGWWSILSLKVVSKTKALPRIIGMVIRMYTIFIANKRWFKNSENFIQSVCVQVAFVDNDIAELDPAWE